MLGCVLMIPQIITEKLKEVEQRLKAFEKRALGIAESRVTTEKNEDLSREIRRLNPPGGKCLPVYDHQDDVMDMIKGNSVSILIGETGSGKSTQLIQYMRSSRFFPSNKRIVCSEPRKVAATSLAERVAFEWDGREGTVGQNVGYEVGGMKNMSESCSMVFMTHRILLNAIMQDPNLSQYSAVIVDEAHERSITTDLLLASLKRVIRDRKSVGDHGFRVIITSATLEENIISDYFRLTGPKKPIMKIPGRAYPVEVEYVDSFDKRGKVYVSMHKVYVNMHVCQQVIPCRDSNPPFDVCVMRKAVI
jgi:HrpA-like RNA helicase